MSNVQMSIGMIIASFAVGFLVCYLLSDFEKKQKKTAMDAVLSQLTNFVIFLWVGKIVMNFSTFIREPLVILAYPSNSQSFYFATLLSVLVIGIQAKRGKINLPLFSYSFLYVCLMASFVYEFLKAIVDDNTFLIEYMVLIALLIILFVVLRKYFTLHSLVLIISLGWIVGSLGIAMTKPILTVFGYTMAPWFLIIILMGCVVSIFFNKGKKVS